ncbi:hypothetical protein ACSBR2_003627 [Camellia fascicularis]
MRKRRLCAEHEDANQYLVKRNHVSAVQTSFVSCHDNRGKSHISYFGIYEKGSTSGTNHRSKPDAVREYGRLLTKKQMAFQLNPLSYHYKDLATSMLYTSNSEEAKEFRTYVRTYNNCFAFTSFGVKYDKELCRRNKGIYTFRIQGQVYHFINELTSSDENLSHLQLYFYGTDHEIQNRMKSSEKLNPIILERLIKISHLNPYSIFFRRLEHIDHLNSVQIIIRSNVSLDQRIYNQPSASQVAAIWSENDVLTKEISRDIVVHQISGHSEKVQWYFGCYDPLQYPLLFPYGESGWHYGIERVDKNETKITCHKQSILSVHQAITALDLLIKEAQGK